jgi:carboxyl-terminal processing protease
LNIDKFKLAQKQIEEKAKKYKPLQNYKNSYKFKSLPYEIEAITKDATLKEKRERWHEQLSKDIYVEEALNVLEDLQSKTLVKKPMQSKIKSDNLVKS